MIEKAGNILVKQVLVNLPKKLCSFSGLLYMASYTGTTAQA